VNKIKNEGKYTERLISKRELIYLMMSDETRQIGKNGIRFRGQYYWNEEMPRIIGNKVEIKYDLWEDNEIYVFEKGKMLFIANKDSHKYHPAARLLGDEEDIKILTEALKQKERIKREVINEFKEIIKLGNAYSNDNIQNSTYNIKNTNKTKKLTENERKIKAMKEYMKLIGYKSFANPVEELLKKGVS